jgi:hypothetical protein
MEEGALTPLRGWRSLARTLGPLGFMLADFRFLARLGRCSQEALGQPSKSALVSFIGGSQLSVPPIQFDNSRLKIKRADRHINEIKLLLNEFLKTEFCKASAQFEPSTGRYLLKVESMAKIPPDIPLAIGDAVHCLRVAVDYIATNALPQFADWISFPMGEKREDAIATKAYRKIKETIPDLADFIIDKAKPYKGGDFKIWEICTLDNGDKHRLLIPAVSVQALAGIDAEDENNNRLINITVGVREGMIVFPIATAAPLKITNYGKPTANIFFPQGALFENQPVIPTLVQLAEFMMKTINALEALGFGQVPDPNPTKI